MFDRRCVLTGRQAQPGILHDLFTTITIPNETRSEPDGIAIVMPEEIGKPEIECPYHHFAQSHAAKNTIEPQSEDAASAQNKTFI